jgi:hypothetical protein
MQIQQMESSIAEQQQVVMAAQDLLNQELIRLAEADESAHDGVLGSG